MRIQRLLPPLIVIACTATTVRATTHFVPGSFPTIGQALSIAAPGDTVLVSPGTYSELLNLVDGVILRGADSFDRPILDGAGAGPLLTGSKCGPNTAIESFVFRNALAIGEGGALRLVSCSIAVENCAFEDNRATHGGAIGSEESDFTVTNCTFLGNTATQTGGAIAATGMPSPAIVGCRFENNGAIAGGAVSVRNANDPVIQSSAFAFNAADQGGALWFDLLTGGAVQGCTFVSNEAAASNGAAMFFNALNAAVVTECILSFGSGGGAVRVVTGATPTFGCNDAFGNTGGDSLAGGIDLGTNFSADPLFCDQALGDYRLAPGSPCLPDPPCGLVGAFAGCSVTSAGASIESLTWSTIKARYR